MRLRGLALAPCACALALFACAAHAYHVTPEEQWFASNDDGDDMDGSLSQLRQHIDDMRSEFWDARQELMEEIESVTDFDVTDPAFDDIMSGGDGDGDAGAIPTGAMPTEPDGGIGGGSPSPTFGPGGPGVEEDFEDEVAAFDVPNPDGGAGDADMTECPPWWPVSPPSASFADRAVWKHNRKRQMFKDQANYPIAWSDELAAEAAAHAERVCEMGALFHLGPGENLALTSQAGGTIEEVSGCL